MEIICYAIVRWSILHLNPTGQTKPCFHFEPRQVKLGVFSFSHSAWLSHLSLEDFRFIVKGKKLLIHEFWVLPYAIILTRLFIYTIPFPFLSLVPPAPNNHVNGALSEYIPPFEERTAVRHFWATLHIDHRCATFVTFFSVPKRCLGRPIYNSSLAFLCDPECKLHIF